MPPAIGDLEALNERAADRPGWRGKLGEKLRQAGDFEHWPAFYKSFVRLGEMIARIANHPDGPATISVLSGDVHHSYAARAEVDGVSPGGATVHQLVCSPVHNYVPRVHQARVQARLDPPRGGSHPMVGAPDAECRRRR